MPESGYRPGSFYRVCDRTGFTVRAENTRKQWNGLIVRKESWEARHPQDFVRGVTDWQSVPEPRLPQEPVFITDPVDPSKYPKSY